ncbi:ROK family transcriptional regulator [Mycolicibacterium palauense]|uniref:ROK family transcriptional regulator n=1 Tax=Mycolicibacterium palauense TaxID=2034511 RepID=UPI000BFF1231|nr:ROK family transcriptional regulator [Mycolicibacterium palauense]
MRPNPVAQRGRCTSPRLVVAPSLHVPEAAASVVFDVVRVRGPIARETIARLTSLSVATVNRQVGRLLENGLLRERADLSVAGAVGRPRIPVQVNHEDFLTLGIHIGARMTSIVATDLLGRALDVLEVPTPQDHSAVVLTKLSGTAKRYLRRWHRRRVLWAGVAVGGIVDSASGTVTHARLGWVDAPVGPVLARALGLRVSVASHVDAMAAAELLVGPRRGAKSQTTTLYVYARETVGYALVIGGKVHTPGSGPGSIAGLPAYSELLDGNGTLESTVSDGAVLAAAKRLRLLAGDASGSTMAELYRAARTGSPGARQLLDERARVLGESLALLRDVLNPDDIVVGGQAFTGYPESFAVIQESFSRTAVLPAREIRTTTFGDHVQQAGAGVVSLSALYADPVGSLRRTRLDAVTDASDDTTV